MTAPPPRPGEVLRLDRSASVQFAGANAITIRVVKVYDWPTYDGWVWLRGYVLDHHGQATEARDLFVLIAGCRRRHN